jgi:hypothetical protein
LAPVQAFIDRILETDRRAPRKQRHTARRIHDRLGRERPDAPVAASTVREYVRGWKRAQGLIGRTVCVPQTYDWGRDYGQRRVMVSARETRDILGSPRRAQTMGFAHNHRLQRVQPRQYVSRRRAHGGAHAQMVKTTPEVVAVIDGLLDTHIYSDVADILNVRGLHPGGSARPGCGSRGFSTLRVQYVVHAYGLRPRYDRLHERGLRTSASRLARWPGGHTTDS